AERDPAVLHERVRVRRLAPHDRLEVQVVAGRVAGRADLRDLHPDADGLPVRDEDPVRLDVTVAGLDAVAVVDHDHVAVAAVPAVPRVADDTAGCREDRGAAAGSDVDAFVEAAAVAGAPAVDGADPTRDGFGPAGVADVAGAEFGLL